MPKNIFCSECGQPCPPDAKFCHACGKPLRQVGARDDETVAWTLEVYRCLRDKEAVEAEKLVRAHLAEYPADASAYALLGTSLFAQYQVDDAGDAFKKAFELPHDDFLVHWEYALYLGRLARYGDAAMEANQAMQKATNQGNFERARELHRLMSQKSQGNFIHQSYFPSFSWLKDLFKS